MFFAILFYAGPWTGAWALSPALSPRSHLSFVSGPDRSTALPQFPRPPGCPAAARRSRQQDSPLLSSAPLFGSNPSWISDAMGDEFNEPSPNESSAADSLSLREGLAGFAVDPTLGFVAIVAGPPPDCSDSGGGASSESPEKSDDSGSARQRWVYAVVSTTDKSQIMSAEALTLVQLAGGIDVGAAVLPPEALTRLARDELDDDDDDGVEKGEAIGRVTLVGVEAVPKESSSLDWDSKMVKDSAAAAPSSPERDAKIQTDAPRLHSTIQKLPGLSEATPESVQDAMQLHADASGAIDREGFTNILDALRRGGASGTGDLGGVDFVMTLNIGGGSKKPVKVKAPSSFLALGLAMRYSALVQISPDCLAQGVFDEDGETGKGMGGCGTDELLDTFPEFRPMQQLLEDAQTVDGFISHMFYKENAPNAFE